MIPKAIQNKFNVCHILLWSRRTLQVSNSVVVAVFERPGVDVVEHRGLPPVQLLVASRQQTCSV